MKEMPPIGTVVYARFGALAAKWESFKVTRHTKTRYVFGNDYQVEAKTGRTAGYRHLEVVIPGHPDYAIAKRYCENKKLHHEALLLLKNVDLNDKHTAHRLRIVVGALTADMVEVVE